MENKLDLIELLEYINPATLDYQEWINVGMALKEEGYACSVWDEWSSKDYSRYSAGECQKKWNSFGNYSGTTVTGGTIFQMAKDGGWQPSFMPKENRALDWDDCIGNNSDYVVIDNAYVEGKEFEEPKNFNPVEEITTYLSTLFMPDENVGYVTECWQNDKGKYLPTKGSYDRTAGELIRLLNKCNGDVGSVLGDYNTEAGAWIRFNPLDGNGVKNENVTEFRYALVESDNMELDKQNAILRDLELPIALLVYSGKKSLHAIIKVDAPDFKEYQKRVDYLYNICVKNGMTIDRQNKNPSRLSRLPGIQRGDKKQFIIDKNIGKSSWDEWVEWIEGVNDNLPDPESLADVWDNTPELSPPLIEGILRQGHKMLIAGPSKAGKSFALIELCISLAEGKQWFGFNCAKGKVLYVNLELDRPSCLHRFKDVYSALGWLPNNLKNIDIWNLRGKSIPMDKLAPKLIRRAVKKNYIAIVIDPIYKVITGDENSADQMSNFCNQFDKVCTELGCAVIYCHHHSKGSQGNKRSMDRASGSGVFARDPDALLDLIELPITKELLEQQTDRGCCQICEKYLKRFNFDFDKIGQDDLLVYDKILSITRGFLPIVSMQRCFEEINSLKTKYSQRTAWRIEGTLREFPKFDPLNLWFEYPVHKIDHTGTLSDISLDDIPKNSNYKKNFSKKKTAKQRLEERNSALELAFEGQEIDGVATVSELAEALGCTEKTARKYIKEHGEFTISDSKVTRER